MLRKRMILLPLGLSKNSTGLVFGLLYDASPGEKVRRT